MNFILARTVWYRALCNEFCLSLQANGSTMLNLSLLTSDMWAVLIRIFAYHEKVCKLIVLPSPFFIMKNSFPFFILECEIPFLSQESSQVDWMYFVAFAGVCVGLVIYSGYVILVLFSVSLS